ncbi:hypothetical protein DRZ78_02080 [Candidatus Aerophobetes bacterium]|uniref:Uncharacterized protein n=1 Tax=Aerophobetes bacterium TaxID=2030807 RepID=A0A662D1T6_UNCAE|nr:MAG: hypothetical protein DRZ78_02080 [Candidatus Aerophobetes bacterium]
MVTSLEEVARVLRMKKEKLKKEGLKAYLRERLHELRAEIAAIYLRYRVSSFEELDEKINEGELKESDTFDDFTRLDYLESEEEKLRKLMEKLK